jgi:hypothetical protein
MKLHTTKFTRCAPCGAVAPPETETFGFAERILGRACSEDRDPMTGRGHSRDFCADGSGPVHNFS